MSLDFSQMQQLQKSLQERYAGWWEPVDPAHGKNKLLWMLAEMGEAIQIVKRHPDGDIVQTGEIRNDFIEELADVLMFFNDVMLCYGIKPEELEVVYRAKHERNMIRWKSRVSEKSDQYYRTT